MRKRCKIKRFFGWSIAALMLAMNYTPDALAIRRLPDTIYVEPGQAALLPDFNDIIVLREEGALAASTDSQRLAEVQDGAALSKSSLSYELFGVLPIRQVSLVERERVYVMPGGSSVGVTMYTKGALVVGVADIVTETGETKNPCKAAGLMPGDVIEKAGGETIKDADHLSELIGRSGSAPLALEIMRKGSTQTLTIVPAKDRQDGRWRIGLWARDSTAGVGTLTFYDPASCAYGALGHAITDLDTKEKLRLKNGELIQSSIVDVRHGAKGSPGELKGSFEDAKQRIGSIEKNTEFGIFGKLYQPYTNPVYSEPLPVASQDEVNIGSAEILTTLNAGTRSFKCEIERVSPQSRPTPKGMIVRITDPELLGATGGIVQGMSGSPIIQNGKLIGAVTHVFVNDPSRGYGMFIEWMLEQAK